MECPIMQDSIKEVIGKRKMDSEDESHGRGTKDGDPAQEKNREVEASCTVNDGI